MIYVHDIYCVESDYLHLVEDLIWSGDRHSDSLYVQRSSLRFDTRVFIVLLAVMASYGVPGGGTVRIVALFLVENEQIRR